jgi:alpha-glucosidase
MSIPVYIGLHPHGSYLIFHENSFRGEISFQEQAIARFEGGALRYYFIPGPPNQALKEYLALTGRPPLPPRWALGYHQSRWGYTNERQVREVVEGFRRNELPLDVLHLDIDYMDGFRLFTVDKSRFPDLPGLAKELKENGVQFIPILDCGVKLDPKYPIYEQGIKHGHFLKDPSGKPVRALVWPGWSVFPDFTDSAVRSWWGGHYKTLIEAGAAGIWHDMNEPATFSAWGEPTLPIATRHVMEGRGGSHLEGHNLYGLLMGKAGYEGLKELEPKKRPWLLTRSGWAGIQQYAWHWTADTESTWEMLKQTIPSLLGLSLSGIPFSGPDIGGFSGSPEPELFLRWFQLATFVPFFRNHAAVGTPPREPWRFGPAILKILQKFLRLRVRLIPYLYTLAWEASQTGQPVLRPLFWDNLEDRELWNNDEAFMLGPNLLIAPIFEPGTQTRRQRLPAGDWYSFWDDNLLQGRGEVEAPVNLQTIPLFVRAGSILPMLADGQGIRANTTLALHLYPSEGVSTTSTLYNDAGDGYGAWRVDRYTMEQSGDELNIEWHQDAGDYLFPYKKINLHLHGFAASKVWIDGELLPAGEGPVQAGFFNLIRIEIARI